MIELRNSIRNNWSTTGLELTKELKQYWQSSRPGSPARGLSKVGSETGISSPGRLQSPTALAHLPHLDVPRQESPGRGPSSDFATGYSLGLIGGVRSWVSRFLRIVYHSLTVFQMTKSRSSLHESQTGSPESDGDSSDSRSAKHEKTPLRGRYAERFDGDTEMVEAK